MNNKNFTLWDLEKYQSRAVTDFHINGELTVIWRDWDSLINRYLINQGNSSEFLANFLHRSK